MNDTQFALVSIDVKADFVSSNQSRRFRRGAILGCISSTSNVIGKQFTAQLRGNAIKVANLAAVIRRYRVSIVLLLVHCSLKMPCTVRRRRYLTYSNSLLIVPLKTR